MANSFFRFKQFTVQQDLCAMKVGTDGVLLGAWTEITQNQHRILDVGSGTGLISLMLAQRSGAQIDAIDIEEGAYRQTLVNFEQSPFRNRLRAYHSSLQDYFSEISYDLIVSNPPYFSDSLKSPCDEKNKARHNDTLKLDTLIRKSVSLLAREGSIALILPFDLYSEIQSVATAFHLHLNRITAVYPTKESEQPKRVLVTYSFLEKEIISNTLVIEEKRQEYTPEFIELAKDFYLKL